MPYRARRKAPQPVQQIVTIPASFTGMNAYDGLMTMAITDCIYCDNLMPSEYGMRLRKGYSEWATGLGADVRTIIPFEGDLADAGADKLWAVTEDGIFNVTLRNTQPPYTADVIFTIQGESSGFGVWVEYTNDASDKFLLYADSANGLWQYAESTGLWSVPVITGPDTALINFVTVWKERLWFIEQDSSDAWYLNPNANNGIATKFTFGSKTVHGGDLKAIYNWTIDGGEGVDDYLIAMARGGDVLVYKGFDPDAATGEGFFTLHGIYFIGELPESNRLAIDYGGELYMLSTYGMTSLRDLLQGSGIFTAEANPSSKISRFLREAIQDEKDDRHWAIQIHPGDGFLQIVTPYTDGATATQYNQNLLTKAWGRWRGMPISSADTWNGDYFFGDRDGSVWVYDGVLDGTTLSGTLGQPIKFDVLTSFQPYGERALKKRINFIRPAGVLAGTAVINVQAVYDYAFETIITQPPVQGPAEGSLWDEALWDENVWDYGLSGAQVPLGAAGIGNSIAIGMVGSSTTRLNFAGWDVMYVTGGVF